MTPRVLITDGEQRAVVAAVRGLASAGYAVSVMASSRPAAAQWSRDCARRLYAPSAAADRGAGLVEAVRRELEREPYAALVPGSDAALRAFSRRRDELEPLTRLGLPSDATERAFDKLLLLEEAARHGLAGPASRTCETPSELAAGAQEVGYPLMLKPARSVRTDGAWRQQQSVIVREPGRARTGRGDAGRAVHAAALPRRRPGRVGRGRHRRRRAARHGRRALRPHVAPVGGLRVGLDHDRPARGSRRAQPRPAQRDRVARDLRARVPRVADGRYATIDLNPRVYGSLALAIAAGANLPAIWVGLLQGERRPPVVARAGLHYRWEEGEVRALLRAVVAGRSDELMAVLRPQRHTAWAFTRALDPGPLVARTIVLGRLRGLPALKRFARLAQA